MSMTKKDELPDDISKAAARTVSYYTYPGASPISHIHSEVEKMKGIKEFILKKGALTPFLDLVSSVRSGVNAYIKRENL